MCDNFSSCHSPEVLNEDNSAIWVYCKDCGAQERIGKDKNGNPEHRAYGEFFKRDVLQAPAPLFYKYGIGAKGMNVV